MPNDPPRSSDHPKEPPVPAARSCDDQDPTTLRSEELLQGRVEVLIEHGAETYRLRLTRSGKLILQK